ncbi:MAG: DUF1285 domain-containing protein [Robiginitomaculum sp.]
MVTLNSGKTENSGKTDMEALIKAVKAAGDGALPVDKWHPEFCGAMDMIIRRDGTWQHEGTIITRKSLIKLFSKVLRRDDDGETYLVTPVEKIKIKVDVAPFLAVRVDIKNKGKSQRLFFTTNVGDVVELGPDHKLGVLTDSITGAPIPLVHIRGNLQALLSRPVFYELVEAAIESDDRLGVYSAGLFFPLGEKRAHNV